MIINYDYDYKYDYKLKIATILFFSLRILDIICGSGRVGSYAFLGLRLPACNLFYFSSPASFETKRLISAETNKRI